MALDGQDRKQKGKLRKNLNCLKRKKKWRLRAEKDLPEATERVGGRAQNRSQMFQVCSNRT